jgi:L-histidine Nalpha-methyltransferase
MIKPSLSRYGHAAARAQPQRGNPRMLAEVAEGLALGQKELPPKYFYDQRGSELFEAITRLPEYYQTRTERALLEAWMPELIALLRTRTLVELGAGNAEKSRVILDAMHAAGTAELYVPIDVSATFLAQTATQLRREYPRLLVEPLVADIGEELRLPRRVPSPALIAFIGGTIGNFYPAAASRLLARARAAMAPGDRFLMGVDLRKDVARIEAAYNDAQGVTAEFNRNMLRVLNHELGADFDPAAFEHRAFYSRGEHRIEMHLVSRRPQRVTIPGIGVVGFAEGETLRTEISAKYDQASVAELFREAGLALEAWRTDADRLFALVVGSPA